MTNDPETGGILGQGEITDEFGPEAGGVRGRLVLTF